MNMEFRVPDMGEGIEQATVVRILVQAGATVQQGQDLVEVETEKATMPIQAESAGTIEKILVKPGDKVKVGTVLLSLNGKPAEAKAQGEAKPQATAAKPQAAAAKPQAAAAKQTEATSFEFAINDLGEGISGGTVVSVASKVGDTVAVEQTLFELETEKATIPIPSPVAGTISELRVKAGQKIEVGAVVAVIATQPTPAASAAQTQAAAVPKPQAAPAAKPPAANGLPVPAGPATRRLARELGVDLHRVIGTASGGRVTQDDVKSYVRAMPKGGDRGCDDDHGGLHCPAAAGFREVWGDREEAVYGSAQGHCPQPVAVVEHPPRR